MDISLVTEGLWSGVGAGYKFYYLLNGYHRVIDFADLRQRQADNGHNADAHAHIDHQLEHHGRGRSVADQAAHIVRASGSHIDTPGNDQQFHDHHRAAAEEAQLLADG